MWLRAVSPPVRALFVALTPALVVACDDSTTSIGNSIEVTVRGAGGGSGTVVGSPNPPVSLACPITAGVASEVDCTKSFTDIGGGGVFNITATPSAGDAFVAWDRLVCEHSSGSCGLDCGPADADPNCRLSFTDSGADYSYFMTARFEPEAANTVVFEDDFTDFVACASWTSTITSQTGSVIATDTCLGQPQFYRSMQHSIDGEGSLVVWHAYIGETYDPGTQGAILEVNYSEDRIISLAAFPGGGVGSAFGLEQGGQLYTLSFGAFTDTEWTSLSRSGILASDFSPEPGPDFSAAGDPITFGYLRSNTNTSAGLQQSVHGIDNWRVEIVQQD